jgi:flavodoxin
MKALIVYDSVYGNTAKIANAVADGIPGSRVANCRDADGFGGCEFVVFGTPTHGGRPTAEMNAFLGKIPNMNGIRFAAFDTRSSIEKEGALVKAIVGFFGHAAPRMSDALRKKKGMEVAKPEGFLVIGKEGPLAEGEIARAKEWGKALAAALNSGKDY